MGEILRQRLKQKKFESPVHEAVLALLVTSSQLTFEMDRTCATHGISTQQYNILRILRGAETDGSGGRSCGEISDRMIDRAPDVTRRIDALVKAGLVERDRSEEDRRVVLTRITKKGLALLDKIHPDIVKAQEKLLGSLDAKDCGELTRICERLLASTSEKAEQD